MESMNSKAFLLGFCGVLLVAQSNASIAPDRDLQVPVMALPCSGNASYKVHLSFDDGPKIPETIQVLDILKKYNIKATFLISTEHFPNLAKGKPPSASEKKLLDVIERMKQEGHTVGAHSYEHIEHGNLKVNTPEKIEKNLSLNDKVIDQLNLKKPIPFRFPYGSGWFEDRDPANQAMDDKVMRQVKEHGYRPFHWDIDTWDWSKIKRKALPNSLLRQICTHGGGISLMHDIHKWSADNLEAIIQSIQQSGHKLVSEEEIIKYSPHQW